MALKGKQKRFCEEYIIDLNATQAAIRAGYSEKTAKAIGHENLTKPNVMEYIHKLQNKRSERTEITADMVLKEFAKIGFANIDDFLKVETGKKTVNMNGNEVEYEATEVKVFDTDSVSADKLGAVSEIRQTKDGIVVKLHDKVAALNAIGKHLGMFIDKSEVKLNVPTINIKRADPHE